MGKQGKQITWLLALCVTLWGPLNGLPQFAFLRLPASVRLAVRAGHAPDCRCAQCPDAKSCCCRPADSAAQAFRLMARCDRPQPVSFSSTAKINPPIPASMTAIAPVWIPAPAPRIAAQNHSPRFFTLAPPSQPPRAA